jgi:hypothetical protein
MHFGDNFYLQEVARKKAEKVFCYQNCSDLLWEKIVLVIKKNFEIWGQRPRICKNFEITRTICSNSEGENSFFLLLKLVPRDFSDMIN